MASGDHSSVDANTATLSGKERRTFPRHECRVEAQISAANDLRLKGTVTDISIGGCYVEMLSPLPVDSDAELIFSIGNSTLHIRAKVRTSQSGLGMGLAFTEMDARGGEDIRKITSAIERGPDNGNVTSRRSAASPEGDALTTSSALEAVVRVLLRKGIVTKEELAKEFDKSKG